MLDRKIPPTFHLSDKFPLLKASSLNLENGNQLHYINAGNQEIVKLEFYFDAGYSYQNKALQAAATNQLMLEGTIHKSSSEFAEAIDNLGAYLDKTCQADIASFTIHVIHEKLNQVLPLLVEMFNSPNFSEEEIKLWLLRQKQQFRVNSEKVSFIARQAFQSKLFPQGHPYFSTIQLDDFDQIQRKDLLEFHEINYLNTKMRIYASGKVDNETIDLIVNSFGTSAKENQKFLNFKDSPDSNHGLEHFSLANALQSAIRIGHKSIERNHPDYHNYYLCQVLLGGFFGSRLMKNLREEKGYTYGISCGVNHLKRESVFSIQTEVGGQHFKDSVHQINLEIDRLKTELVPIYEIAVLKNYVKGSMMHNFDGAFVAMDRFITIHEAGLDYGFYEKLFDTIRDFNPEICQKMAIEYLKNKERIEIIAGQVKC